MWFLFSFDHIHFPLKKGHTNTEYMLWKSRADKKIKLPLSRGGLQIPYIQSQYMVLPYIHVVHKGDI